jgi:hypothetical protein
MLKLVARASLLLLLAAGGSLPMLNEVVPKVSASPNIISGQLLHNILMACLHEWPQYNYGQLRSAYNSGELTIVPVQKVGHVQYDIIYEGVELCVLIDA